MAVRTVEPSMARFRLVAGLVVGCILIAMLAVLGRVAQLQLFPGADLLDHMSPRVTTRTQLPLRGDLLDRRGRLLSATRFGQRVFVDPMLFPDPPHDAIVALADALELPPEKIGTKLVEAMDFNALLAARAAGNDSSKPTRSFLQEFLERQKGDKPSLSTGEGDQDASEVPETAGDAVADAETPKERTTPVRFIPVSGVVSDETVKRIRDLKIKGVGFEKRQVREYPGGDAVASIVGKVGVDHVGLMGAEERLNDELVGTKGSIDFVRDAYGRPLWVEPGHVVPSQPGVDVRLTIDVELQRIAYEELLKGVEEADAAGGRMVIVDPATGEVMAMVDIVRDVPGLVPYPWVDKPVLKKGQKAPPEPNVLGVRRRYITLSEDKGRAIHPALGRNRCVEDIYEPGSTFKPFVWSVITETGLAKTSEVFDTEGGRWHTSYGRYIEDVTKRPTMTWSEVLVNSSNIGMIKATERLSYAQLRDVVTRFGFGKKTNLGLRGEGAGRITSAEKWGKYTQTSVAYGHEISVTPLQMVRAFSAFARSGDKAGTLPHLQLIKAIDDQPPPDATPGVVYRVLPADVAVLTRQTMTGVVTSVESRWITAPEGGWRYTLFGKSGTAEISLGKAPDGKKRPRGSSGYFDDQYNSSFIAGGPVEDPRLVCIVVIDDPGPERIRKRSHYGAAVAGPVVRRVMERGLAYLGAPVSVKPPLVGADEQTSLGAKTPLANGPTQPAAKSDPAASTPGPSKPVAKTPVKATPKNPAKASTKPPASSKSR